MCAIYVDTLNSVISLTTHSSTVWGSTPQPPFTLTKIKLSSTLEWQSTSSPIKLKDKMMLSLVLCFSLHLCLAHSTAPAKHLHIKQPNTYTNLPASVSVARVPNSNTLWYQRDGAWARNALPTISQSFLKSQESVTMETQWMARTSGRWRVCVCRGVGVVYLCLPACLPALEGPRWNLISQKMGGLRKEDI